MTAVTEGPLSAAAGGGTTVPTAPEWGQSVVNEAQKYLGVPYQWGGTDPSTGVDCSGLVQDVFADMGVKLPRTADQQSSVGTGVASLADAQPGDLVFFAGSDGTAAAPGHVGIYMGNGQMIDAPHTGTDVTVEPVSDAGPVVAIRRVAEPSSSFAAPATYGPGSSGAGGYGAEFSSASSAFGVPAGLLQAVAKTESDDNPDAVSAVGAEGLMQLMPSTASSLGADPFSTSQAINAAASLLASYHQQFGTWSLAVAAYNAGPAAVSRYGGVPPYAETEDYVDKVMSRAGMEGE